MNATIGTYGDRGQWVAVALVQTEEETLVVDERMRQPGDAGARGRLAGRFSDERRARAFAELRVLALGGLIGEEPETAAGSPVRGQAAGELCPGAFEFPDHPHPPHGDGEPVHRELASDLLAGPPGRFLHVLAPVASGR